MRFLVLKKRLMMSELPDTQAITIRKLSLFLQSLEDVFRCFGIKTDQLPTLLA